MFRNETQVQIFSHHYTQRLSHLQKREKNEKSTIFKLEKDTKNDTFSPPSTFKGIKKYAGL